ncbi:DUF4270 domain-containing protein [Parabacteroides sp. PF5-6]|uniref:DUF4270 domain-containing protein n=1 Tax=Parabacteroides sp. PF5-6 TaxID=1742403 RepID=UPI0032168A7E|nr:hypothetical protein [Parabacteroides sp. PF5-6]
MKRIVLGLFLAFIFCLGSCDDDLTRVGTSIQGDSDKISVSVDSFYIEASTVLMESVYARADTGLLGEFYDPLYGTLKSDYICQFYCPAEFQFKHTPINGKIDSVDFRIFYDTWVGDSLAPMRAQIYPIVKPLEKNFYTDVNPEDYADMQASLGMQTYTAFDRSVPDSVRYATDYYGNSTFYPVITVRMPQELGQKFYEETVNNPSSFKDQDAFNEFFPGLYVTNTFGSGNIIGVDVSYFTIYYKYMDVGSEGQDTIIKTSEVFNVTKEVIQFNRFKNTNMDHLIEPNANYTYIKTPAGVCTKLVIPAREIAPFIDGRILNNMPLALYPMPQDEYEYALTMPETLLILPEDSVKSFFENSRVEDGITSFVASYSSASRAYSFGNLSNVLTNHIENSPEKDLSLLVIPVKQKQESNSYYGTVYTTSLSHYLFPYGMKLRKDDAVMKVGVTSSKYGKN